MNPTIVKRILDLCSQIQQIPAPTFKEEQRARFIQSKFNDLRLNDVCLDECGNVYARLKGQGKKPAIVVSAHLDTVFAQTEDLPLHRTKEKISGPGIGDNSLGLAGLIGLCWALGDSRGNMHATQLLEGDLWLVADVCEEGLGDLRGMKSVVDRIGEDAFAYLILEGMSFGQIYHRGLGVRRYRITVHTKGGHSWVDYGNPSAIHELAEMVVKMKNLALPVEPRTSLNVGMISGGTSVNTIAADASLEIDLRSVNTQALNVLIGQVLSIVEETNRKFGDAIIARAEVIGDRPAGEIPANHPLVKLASGCYARNGTNVKLNIGSTDANVPLSRGLPSICVGLTTGGGAHTMAEYIDTQPLEQGIRTLVDIVQTIFHRGITNT